MSVLGAIKSYLPAYLFFFFILLAGASFVIFPRSYLRFIEDIVYRRLFRLYSVIWPFYDPEKKLFYWPKPFSGERLYYHPTVPVNPWAIRLVGFMWMAFAILGVYLIAT